MRTLTCLLLFAGLMACDEESALEAADAAGAGGPSGEEPANEGSSGGGDPERYDGAYLGEIIIVGSAIDVDGSTESCSGVVELDVAVDANPEIDGFATCTFAGWLDWMGEQTLVLTGGSVGEDGAEGTVTVTIEGVDFEEEWVGVWEDEHLSAWFSGTKAYELGSADFEVVFEGSFTARRLH